MITDDEISSLLIQTLPDGVRLTCVMDSCHSGTGKLNAIDLLCLTHPHQDVTCPTLGILVDVNLKLNQIPTTLSVM
jgi:hypothetical protein